MPSFATIYALLHEDEQAATAEGGEDDVEEERVIREEEEEENDRKTNREKDSSPQQQQEQEQDPGSDGRKAHRDASKQEDRKDGADRTEEVTADAAAAVAAAVAAAAEAEAIEAEAKARRDRQRARLQYQDEKQNPFYPEPMYRDLVQLVGPLPYTEERIELVRSHIHAKMADMSEPSSEDEKLEAAAAEIDSRMAEDHPAGLTASPKKTKGASPAKGSPKRSDTTANHLQEELERLKEQKHVCFLLFKKLIAVNKKAAAVAKQQKEKEKQQEVLKLKEKQVQQAHVRNLAGAAETAAVIQKIDERIKEEDVVLSHRQHDPIQPHRGHHGASLASPVRTPTEKEEEKPRRPYTPSYREKGGDLAPITTAASAPSPMTSSTSSHGPSTSSHRTKTVGGPMSRPNMTNRPPSASMRVPPKPYSGGGHGRKISDGASSNATVNNGRLPARASSAYVPRTEPARPRSRMLSSGSAPHYEVNMQRPYPDQASHYHHSTPDASTSKYASANTTLSAAAPPPPPPPPPARRFH